MTVRGSSEQKKGTKSLLILPHVRYYAPLQQAPYQDAAYMAAGVQHPWLQQHPYAAPRLPANQR